MSQREIETRCACLIANLEGRRGLTTTGYNDPPFLEDLDRRLRFIELRNDVVSAPPTHAPTWESLAWRICRLDNPTRGVIPKTLIKSHFGSLLPESNDVEFDAMVRIVGDLAAKVSVMSPPGALNVPCQAMPPLPKLADDEEKLDIIRQRLFFVAGKKQYRIVEIPMTKRDVYILAADLSLELESNFVNGPHAMPNGPLPHGAFPRGPLPNVPAPPPGWERPPLGRKKPCCGCCVCSCHPPAKRGIDFFRRKKDSKFKKFFKFGWLKSLACWRKKKTYTSSTSSSRSTLSDV